MEQLQINMIITETKQIRKQNKHVTKHTQITNTKQLNNNAIAKNKTLQQTKTKPQQNTTKTTQIRNNTN